MLSYVHTWSTHLLSILLRNHMWELHWYADNDNDNNDGRRHTLNLYIYLKRRERYPPTPLSPPPLSPLKGAVVCHQSISIAALSHPARALGGAWQRRGSNTLAERRTLKAAAEAEMAVAANILLSSSSVIIVGKVFCLAYVELDKRNSTTGNFAIFSLRWGISRGWRDIV